MHIARSIFLILTIVASGRSACAQSEKPPNIPVILMDDMGYGDPACYNPTSKIPTPHIDRLAQEGMRFTDAHAPGPLCHPSRYAMMVDAQIGRILAMLDKTGMTRETLVISTSDNGPVWYPEDVAKFGHDSAGGLRGMKGDAWEAGHRMPFIVRWPGRVEAGTVSEQTVCLTDLLATFADICGKPLPAGAVTEIVARLAAEMQRIRKISSSR
jgi:arylsulfatase A-like enzyme